MADDRIRDRLDTALLRHKTDLTRMLRELGRQDEARLIENGAGFSLYAGEA